MSNVDMFPNHGKPVIDRPLIAFAFLAQATHVSGDLLSGLTPIFKPICKGKVGKRFDPAEFSREVQSLYGVEIHPWAVDDLAPRLEAAGLLIKNKVSKTSIEYVYAEVVGDFNDVSESDIKVVIQKFINFATPTLVLHKVEVSKKALEDAFLEQLVAMDFHSILLKPDRTKEDQKTLSTLSIPKDPDRIKWEEDISARSKIDVLCASFIVHSFQNNKSLYDLIVRIASGALIAEVVLNIQDPGTSITLNSLKVVLDAPFVMSLLDLSSEEATAYARRIFDTLKLNGASISAFRHSLEEIHLNLKGVVNNVSHGQGYGPTARRLANSTFNTYVASVMQDVEAAVSRDDIKIIDSPSAPSVFQHFSEADETAFKLSLGYFENPAAQARDAASVAGIMRLRQGKTAKMSRFHQAQYVFVTENPWIAERAASFAIKKNFMAANEVPPAITDRYLAGLMWVLFGGKAEELTQYRLLANCTAALEPRNDVMAKMHRFLTQLDEQKANHFRALMTDERSGQHLMQLTLGDSVLITSTSDAEQILGQIEANLGEKYRKELEETVSELSHTHQKEVSHLLSQKEVLTDEVQKVQAEVLGVRDEVKKIRDQSSQLDQDLATEKLLRMEEKRLFVEKSVEFALLKVSDRQRLISIGIGLAAMACAFAGTDYLTQYGKWISAVGAVIAGLITYFAFWKNPDLLFESHLINMRDSAFRFKLDEYHVEPDLKHFEVDWQNKRVEIKASS